MRNYFSTRGMQWRCFLFDDTHNPQGDFPVCGIGRDDVDLQSEIQIANAAIVSGLPPLWTAEFTYDREPMTMFFLLDKDSFMVTAKGFASTFVSDAVANSPPAFPILVNPKTSPRYTGWKDPAGVARRGAPSDKRRPTSDTKGAQGILHAAKEHLAYYQPLQS